MAAIWLAPLPLSVPAHRMASIMALVVVLWVTEALPMAATAVLGPLLAVVLRVADARAALAPFADPIIFLFIGSFMLAEAMFVHGVDRRIAYTALSWKFVGRSAPRVLLVYSAVATALSMWMSNTATTAMMFPIGLALISHMMQIGPRDEVSRATASALRAGADVDDLVRRVGWRHGDAGRHAAEPHRHRHARAHRRRPHLVLHVDGHRAAAGAHPVWRADGVVHVDDGARRADGGGRRGPGARGARQAGTAVGGPAQRAGGLWRDGAAVDLPGLARDRSASTAPRSRKSTRRPCPRASRR